jgi:hypothetical protein
VGGRGRPKDDSTEGEKTQSFPCMITMWNRFRQQKYRNGGQLWAVNVFSYTIHAQTDCWQSPFPLAPSIFLPLLLWRFPSSQLFCVHFTATSCWIVFLTRLFRLADPTNWNYGENVPMLEAYFICGTFRVTVRRVGKVLSWGNRECMQNCGGETSQKLWMTRIYGF